MNPKILIGLESKLEVLLNCDGDITPNIIKLEESVSVLLARIDDALNPLRMKIHRELSAKE
jgi:hypothetical protein